MLIFVIPVYCHLYSYTQLSIVHYNFKNFLSNVNTKHLRMIIYVWILINKI